MTDKFKTMTDQLFVSVGAEELADEIGCSIQSVKQARMGDRVGRRAPPQGWEESVRKLAQNQADHFTRLVKRITKVE